MFEIIRANQRRTAILIFTMALVLFAAGYAASEIYHPGSGLFGLAAAIVIWIILLTISYFGGDSIFLTMSRAKQIKKQDAPMLYNVVEEMKIASGVTHMPKIYIIDDPAPNAFATGRNPERASIAVTTGLLEILDRYELQGVIAHEMAHINNRDILYMMMISAMLGTIVLLADMARRAVFFGGSRRRSRTSSVSKGGGQAQLVIIAMALILMIVAPIIARLVYFAVSRRREYLADASAAQYTRYPEGLAKALDKLAGNTAPLRSASRATAPMYIVNPLALTKTGLSDLSSTHPPISKRIAILRSLGSGMSASKQISYESYNKAYKKVMKQNADVIPSAVLSHSMPVAAIASAAVPTQNQTPLERHRETTDTLWRMRNYIFIPCSCDTKLKVPQSFLRQTIKCPHCKKEHNVNDYYK